MIDPISTYRIQFNRDFTLKNLEGIITYLHRLGIKTIYASPIFEAVPGSTHGYDTLNPHKINPEIGTLEELRRISARLKSLGMYWIQDIVPNHMGFHHQNPWLMDVLKNGEKSAYRKYFDILSKDLNEEPLMLPFLGDSLEAAIKKGELKLADKNGKKVLSYFDSDWPLRVDTDFGQPLQAIVESQYYRPCAYLESNEKMNYRRFFTVNSLICLNIQDEETFNAYHRLIKQLLEEDIFQGLRIDHIDGLYDPLKYLQDLRKLCGKQIYIVVEKILEPGERLPKAWPVQGTTGYDFLGLVNQVFINEKAEKNFDKFYKPIGQYSSSVQHQILKKKSDFLFTFMKGELENLYQLFLSLNPFSSDDEVPTDPEVFKNLIAEILVRCPVYRYYGNQYPLPEEDQEAIQFIFSSLKNETEYEAPIGVLKKVLFENIVFYQRLMQFTGPLMAKGVEDTLMYTYNRFIGSNEVGDSPDVFGISIDNFHEVIEQRQQDWPLAMNASSTHDTKRGEDARARLQVLTDLRKEWLEEVKAWQTLNEELVTQEQPDTNDTYFIYQTLVATYPETSAEQEVYRERLQEYMEKALRESKRNSNWDSPDEAYEQHTRKFIQGLLDPDREFWMRFNEFHQKVCQYGRINSLAALLLKHGCPGIPDTYQGDELWNLSMVDPDNRRAVDYALRQQYVKQFRTGQQKLSTLWLQGDSGQIKLFMLQKLLKLRRKYPVLFAEGAYSPVTVTGKHASNVIAFARSYKKDMFLFVVPINLPAVKDWEDTKLVLPAGATEGFLDVFRDHNSTAKTELPVKDIFADVPLAVLHFQQQPNKRAAGILMPVFSLPSSFGIGDLGPAAADFISFLAAAGQKYWQMLPLNPVNASQAYSPYSSTSVMAGNTILISPDLLVKDSLLATEDLRKYEVPAGKKIRYARVEKAKRKLFALAYQNFIEKGESLGLKDSFDQFCVKEAAWLDDYALFVAISKLHPAQGWTHWPVDLRTRQPEALQQIVASQESFINEVKWQQYIFDRQWRKLRQTANAMNIRLIGDLPFYAALDSADVWAHPSLFNIDKNGVAKGLAGVPPDYFNADGQLWGMPVYNWKALEKDDYQWWIDRLRRNLELVDLLRLDHFRAFSSYWEVPAGSENAKTGKWHPGPGKAFLEVMKENFKQMPFVAEDLGEIDDAVYVVRDAFRLPGMKVLQFAFGEDSASSMHIPHQYPDENCFVYTGTHDNDTLTGWFKNEVDKSSRKRISDYVGYKVNKANIHLTMIRMAYASIAKIAIVPMQDVLGKSTKARMNTPASTEKNWQWRLKMKEQLNFPKLEKLLKEWVDRYGRG